MGEADFLAGGGEMGRLMRQLDWARTPLGDTSTWPQSLRTSVSTCLNSRFPILIWWGPELAKLYNDAYRPMLANKHPRSMGAAGRSVWPEIWDIIGPMLGSVMAEGKATWSEDQMLPLHRKGYVEECYFTFSYSPIRDESGGVGGVFSALNETTERVLGERRLRVLRELSAHLAEARSDDQACSIAARTLSSDPQDVPFALLYLLPRNGAQVRLSASTGVQREPRAPSSLPDDDFAAAWALERLLESGEPQLVRGLPPRLRKLAPGPWPNPPEAALALPVARSGQPRPYGVIVLGISPRLELDESYLGFCSLVAGQVATAIGNARAYEEERERAEALAQIDRAKTAFFSNISHEFRTPLTLLLGPLEDALAVSTQPSDRERLELIQRNALRLKKLVNTLLDFSRIEAGRVEASYEPTDICALTAELSSMFRSATERAGLQLTVDAPPLSQPVYLDREMWEKIVLNLLSNAFKFTFVGGIEVSVREQEGEAHVTVRDTGTGIAADQLGRIFDRFHRVEGARSRTHEGSGIGLALVKELVELHGGRILVASEPNVGTTFTLRIPFGSAHLPADRVGAPRTQSSTALGAAPYVEEALRWLPDEGGAGEPGADGEASPAGAPATTSTSPTSRDVEAGHVLVVDDNSDMREYLEHVLEPFWTVTTAADGHAALGSVRTRRPDLVLSDVMMPGLNGFGLLESLRSDPATREIPVLLLSARAGEEARIEGMNAGADDYLIKPFSPRELVARVRSHLETARVRREVAAERERLLKAEQLARKAAESANESKVRFLATMSHELRTPLNAIMGFCSLLSDEVAGPLVPGQRAQVRRIEGASRHLLQIIEQILSFARIEAGREEVRAQSVDLANLVRETAAYVEPMAAAKQLRLVVGAPAAVPAHIDPNKVRQILLNLLANAIKFTESGQIGLSITSTGAQATISVSDTGIGIAPEDLERVFEPFQQIRPLDAAGGTGLGLSVSRRLARLLGGDLVARSEQRNGSVFTLHLPARPELLEAASAGRPAPTDSSSADRSTAALGPA
jgi:signal transduction histidine kinase